MMKRGKQTIKSYMTLEYEFTGIRVQDAYLTPVDWKLKVILIAPARKGISKEKMDMRLAMMYQRLYFWLDTNLPNIVVVDVSKEDDLYVANLISNLAMHCPGGSGDDLLIQLLHSKLTALAGKELIVGEMQVKGSDATLQYTFDSHEGEYSLPDTAEYYTDGKTRDSKPWWTRNDGFCFEFAKPTDEEMSNEEYFKDIFDPMTEFERVMSENKVEEPEIFKEPAKIVQVEKWKPKTVE